MIESVVVANEHGDARDAGSSTVRREARDTKHQGSDDGLDFGSDPALTVHVNLSGKQFIQSDLANQIAAIIPSLSG